MTTGEQRRNKRDQRAESMGGKLSGRQREILICRCVYGMTSAETGIELFIAEGTVKSYVARLLDRFAVRTMNQACYILGKLYREGDGQNG